MDVRKFGDRVSVKSLPRGESRVQRSFIDETNINTIMSRFERTGMIEHVNRHQGQYGDFTVLPDFHTALNKIREAEEMFLTLPAKVRKKFANDVGGFLAFVSDPANEDEMRELGLLPSKRQPENPAAAVEPQGETPAPEAAEPAE